MYIDTGKGWLGEDFWFQRPGEGFVELDHFGAGKRDAHAGEVSELIDFEKRLGPVERISVELHFLVVPLEQMAS